MSGPAYGQIASNAPPRRGDRVVVKTRGDEVMAKELGPTTARTVELISLNSDYEDRILDPADILWMARIVWASQ